MEDQIIQELRLLRLLSSKLNQEILDLLKIEKGLSVEKAARILNRPLHSLRERFTKLSTIFILNKLQLSIYWLNKDLIVVITDLASGNTLSSEDITLSTSVEFHHLVNTLKDVQTYKLYEYVRHKYRTTKNRTCFLYEVLESLGDLISYDKASLDLLKLVNLDLIEIETGGIPPNQLRTIQKNQDKIAKNIKIHLKKLVEISLVPTAVNIWTALQSYLRVIESEEEKKERAYLCPLCETGSLTFIEHKDGSWTAYCQNSGCMASWYIENDTKRSLTRDDVFDMITGKTTISDIHLITPSASDNFIQYAQVSLQKKGVAKFPYDIRILKVNRHFKIDANLVQTSYTGFPTFIDEQQLEKVEAQVTQFYENTVSILQKIDLLISLGFEQKAQNQKELFFTRNAQTENEAMSIVKTLIEKYDLLNVSGSSFETKVREFRKGFPNHRFEMTIPKKAATSIGLKEGMKAKVHMHIIPEWR